MIETKTQPPENRRRWNRAKTGRVFAAVFICLSIICLIDLGLFRDAHGMLPWWTGMFFSSAALVLMIVNKSRGLFIAIGLAGYFWATSIVQISIIWDTDLEGAIVSSNIGLIERRIQQGADVNALTSDGDTMLRTACRYWRIGSRGRKDFENEQAKILEMMEVLIESGADVNQADRDSGQTPLHHAVYRKAWKVVEFLLVKGANPDLKDREGNTAMHYAVTPPFCPYGEDLTLCIVRLLIERRANVNARNNAGVTPLGLVIKEEDELYKKIAQLLRLHGAVK